MHVYGSHSREYQSGWQPLWGVFTRLAASMGCVYQAGSLYGVCLPGRLSEWGVLGGEFTYAHWMNN